MKKINIFVYILIIFFLSSCTLNRLDSKIYYKKTNYKNLEISSYIYFSNDKPGNILVINLIDTTLNKFEINQIKVNYLDTLINLNDKSYYNENLRYMKSYYFILTDKIVNDSKHFTLFFDITYKKSKLNISDSIIIYEDNRVIKKDIYEFLDNIFPNIGH